MILVLLYKFSESQESLPGYNLCQKLVQEGHEILVTTTSSKDELNAEKEVAKYMTEKWRGSVTILEPEYEELEEPNAEWIAKLHRAYFGFLSCRTDVHTIIATLPGTTKTAVDLKKDLKCRLILLATTKIGADQEQLKAEVNRQSVWADEVWSLGSDIFNHYQDIFQEVTTTSLIRHNQIHIQPYINNALCYWQWNDQTRSRTDAIRKIVSVWNDGYPFYYKGSKTHSRGSSVQGFCAFSAALVKLNEEAVQRDMGKIQWNVHGLKGQEQTINSIQGPTNSRLMQLVALSSVKSLEEITWKNCSAFIVPDYNDESFNFIALAALWQGIPTLVSRESGIGKFLLSLSCPQKLKPLVALTGDAKIDKDIWLKKIYYEILNHNANPVEWAKQLSTHLHNSARLWEISPATTGVVPPQATPSWNHLQGNDTSYASGSSPMMEVPMSASAEPGFTTGIFRQVIFKHLRFFQIEIVGY